MSVYIVCSAQWCIYCLIKSYVRFRGGFWLIWCCDRSSNIPRKSLCNNQAANKEQLMKGFICDVSAMVITLVPDNTKFNCFRVWHHCSVTPWITSQIRLVHLKDTISRTAQALQDGLEESENTFIDSSWFLLLLHLFGLKVYFHNTAHLSFSIPVGTALTILISVTTVAALLVLSLCFCLWKCFLRKEGEVALCLLYVYIYIYSRN